MTEPAAKKKKKNKNKKRRSSMSQLPEELLNIIINKLDNCFDVVHARSVCSLWRSIFPFPSLLSSPSYSLPSFTKFPLESKDLCILKKVPLFLVRVRAPASPTSAEYFLGGIGLEDHIKLLPSSLQCSVKLKLSYSTLMMNMLDCQRILHLGYQYRMICSSLEDYLTGVVFLPLNKEGGGGEEFVVLLTYSFKLLVLTSAKMRWKQLKNIPNVCCSNIVTYRGNIYVLFYNDEFFVINPYSLEVTSLTPLPPLRAVNYLVPSSNDELFLIRKIFPTSSPCNHRQITCRVSRLDVEAGKWVEVSDLGDRVLFIGRYGNVFCSAKELPHGCGLSGNSILFTDMFDNVAFLPGRAEDELNIWRYSTENPVVILNKNHPVLAFRFER